ncbi:MAG: DUF3108 domain-containing protein [Verrucomicrobiota bacterium]
MKPTLLFLMIFATAAASWANGETNVPFRVGEKLTYQIYWGPFIGGKATLEVAGIEKIASNDCYHLIAEAYTTGLVDMLYHVKSRTESWLDVDELCTRRYRQERTEGKRFRSDDSLYDYSNKHLVTTNYVTGKPHTYALDAPVQDMISCLYYVRSRPLQLDVTEQFPVVLGSTRYDVTVKPDERKTLFFRPTGNVQALRIEPNPTIAVVSANKGRMWFWVSDDPRKLLLLITSDMKIGSAKFVLTQVEPATTKSGDKR